MKTFFFKMIFKKIEKKYNNNNIILQYIVNMYILYSFFFNYKI